MELPNPPISSGIGELPVLKYLGGAIELHQYEGFWYALPHLKGAIAARSHFEARDDDVLLASSIKTGTTWLKALIPSIINNNNLDGADPLVENHPNMLMPSFELQIYKGNPNADLSGMLSPRLFRTHVPYTMLPDSVKLSACKIVYITRDPKDAFVPMWHFINANFSPPSPTNPDQRMVYPIDEAFESYCNGVHHFGPFHDHVLGYWKESLKRPEKILFLKYEELKNDTKGQLKKLASFLGRPFVDEEELDKVIWRCSLDRLKNLEVNRNGVDPGAGITYKSYFRLGLVGDWKNNLSPEMEERLDNITRKKLEGSGLELGI